MFVRALATFFIAATAASANCDPGETEIVFHHDAPAAGHPKGEAASLLASFVNGELDGRVCMTVVAEAPGYSDGTVLDGLSEGRYQMAAPAMGNLGSITERFLIFDLPFMFRDLSVVLEYQEGQLARELLVEAEEDGLLGLAYWTDGMKAISAPRPIELPEDLEGLTFGIQDAVIEQFYFEEMGAQTETMELAELSEALAEGEVDGQNTTWTNITSRNLALDHDIITESNHGLVQYMVVTSPEFWNSLEPDLRDELQLLIDIVSQDRNRFAFELANIAKLQLQSDGVEIDPISEEEYRTWRLAMQSTWLTFGGKIGFDQISAVTFANQRAREIYNR